MIQTGVSVAAAGACVSTAAVLYCAERLPGIKRATNKLHTDRIQALLITTAVVGLAGTGAGTWWNQMVTDLNTWAASAIGSWTGIVVTGVAGLLCAIYYVNDLITRRVEMRTLVLAALFPVLILSIPGPIGAGLAAVVQFVTGGIASLVSLLFGLGG